MFIKPIKAAKIQRTVRDDGGRKMSKSLGNGVDPLEFIERFGADTLRFSLLNGVASGNDMRFKEDKVGNTRNFMNKMERQPFCFTKLRGQRAVSFGKLFPFPCRQVDNYAPKFRHKRCYKEYGKI